MRRRLLFTSGLKGTIVTSNYKVGNLVLYDKINSKKVIIDVDNPSDTFPVERYYPLAVVVIPTQLNIYSSSKAAAMSLVGMNCNTPDTGGDDQQMVWGESRDFIATIGNGYHVPYTGTVAEQGKAVEGVAVAACLPCDMASGITCQHDTNAKYNEGLIDAAFLAPSPYLTDGSRNAMYYQTKSPSSALNCLAHIAGENATETIIAPLREDYTTNIEVSATATNTYPAAVCCFNFHPTGTSRSDWYLPGAGELGYAIARQGIIQNTIQKVIDNFGSEYAVQMKRGVYWTSTTCSQKESSSTTNVNIKTINTANNMVSSTTRTSSGYVRAYIKI